MNNEVKVIIDNIEGTPYETIENLDQAVLHEYLRAFKQFSSLLGSYWDYIDNEYKLRYSKDETNRINFANTLIQKWIMPKIESKILTFKCDECRLEAHIINEPTMVIHVITPYEQEK